MVDWLPLLFCSTYSYVLEESWHAKRFYDLGSEFKRAKYLEFLSYSALIVRNDYRYQLRQGFWYLVRTDKSRRDTTHCHVLWRSMTCKYHSRVISWIVVNIKYMTSAGKRNNCVWWIDVPTSPVRALNWLKGTKSVMSVNAMTNHWIANWTDDVILFITNIRTGHTAFRYSFSARPWRYGRISRYDTGYRRR